MLNPVDAMPRLPRPSLALASIPAISLVLAFGVARAQTTTVASSGTSSTTTTGTATPSTVTCSTSVLTPTVTVPADQSVPERYVNGVDLGTTTRPVGLIQTGISYADCIADMVLQFRTIVCGFTGSPTAYNLEIWASTMSDCTATADRGVGGTGAICWPLGAGSTDLLQADGPENYNIRVQDIVGPQNQYPSVPTYSRQGPSACNEQPTSLAVPININFVPVDSSGTYAGSGAL